MRSDEALVLGSALVIADPPWSPVPAAVCAKAEDGTERLTTRLETTVDASIDPGNDFFAYANGGWLKATAVPAGKERWGRATSSRS